MNRSMPGLPVHHQLPVFIHQVCGAIQPSDPLSSPLPPASIPPSIRVFSSESTLHMRWRKYWSFNFSIIPSREHPHSFSPLHFSSHTSHLELLVSYLSYVKVYRYSLKCKVILRKQHGYSELKSRLILSMIRPYNGPVSGSP